MGIYSGGVGTYPKGNLKKFQFLWFLSKLLHQFAQCMTDTWERQLSLIPLSQPDRRSTWLYHQSVSQNLPLLNMAIATKPVLATIISLVLLLLLYRLLSTKQPPLHIKILQWLRIKSCKALSTCPPISSFLTPHSLINSSHVVLLYVPPQN